MNDFISLHDCTPEEIQNLLTLALKLKKETKEGIEHHLLKGKTLGMIFTKSSTRTRVSFEVGMVQLGGYPMFLSANDIQLGRGETIYDTAKVLERYLDGIMIRTFSHQDVLDLAEHADIPIINALTDLLHPCQVLADLQTIYEKKGKLKGLKLTENAKADFKASGANLIITEDPVEAIKNADIVYTDTWVSMGMEAEKEERIKKFMPYQVNSELMKNADSDAIFMHCLPAYRGYEVSEDVIDGKHSVIFDEAENRLHAQKAVLATLMGK